MGTTPDLVLRYADHGDGILDVHRPPGPVRGVVVLLHGGFWRSIWDRTHIRPMAAALAVDGWLVVTPEYRRAGAGGGWPMTFDDVTRAAGSARALLAEAGAAVADTVPTVLVGHSAGGHLALWLATRPETADVVDRVVALAPVGDLDRAWADGTGDTAIADFLGRPLPEADPALLLRERAPTVPVVVLHGALDDEVPVDNSAWAKAVADVDLRVLPDVEHYGLITPTAPVWPTVAAAIGEGAPR